MDKRSVIIGLILLAGLSIRLAQHSHPPSRDECFTWRLMQRSPAHQISQTASDVHPPFYYLILWLWVSVWGDSVRVMRMFSACVSLGSLALFIIVSRETTESLDGEVEVTPHAAIYGLAIMSFHPAHIEAGSTARMYGLGLFMCAAATYCLVKSLQRGGKYWLAYSLFAAGFCFTHYYALFAIFAHAIFTYLLGPSRSHSRIVAFSAVALCYCVWLPTLFSQAKSVHQQYWIDSYSHSELLFTFVEWCTGCQHCTLLDVVFWCGTFAVLAVISISRGVDRFTYFWALGVVVPWFAAIGYEHLTGTSIIQKRYFLFAHFSLVGLISTAVFALPHGVIRIGLGFLILLQIIGHPISSLLVHRRSHAIEDAVQYLSIRASENETVLCSWHGELNQVHYFFSRLTGKSMLNIRALIDPEKLRGGHITHSASFDAGELVSLHEVHEIEARRFWIVGELLIPTPPGFKIETESDFTDSFNSWRVTAFVAD